MRASKLAILGGTKTVVSPPQDLYAWPLIGEEDEAAVLDLLRKPNFIDSKAVEAIEEEFSEWLGSKYALACSSGTSAIEAALFACGVGPGSEVIAPSLTHWASVFPAFRLGATVVFADVLPSTLNLDPVSVGRLVTSRTRIIVVVHQHGRPCDMDALKALAKSHSVALLEDASHALGSRYKGRKVGVLGDVGIFSLNGKSLAAGEGGMLVTNDRALFERALAWGHDHRFTRVNVQDTHLQPFAGLPLGGTTSRMHNLTAALARVQLRHFQSRMEIVDAAMKLFWDRLKDVSGVVAHGPPAEEGSTMGCWYRPLGLYEAKDLGGLDLSVFAAAVSAEGVDCGLLSDFRQPLHVHARLRDGGDAGFAGAPQVRCRFDTNLRATENVSAFTVPRFSKLDPVAIEAHAEAFAKVVRHHKELLSAEISEMSSKTQD